MLVLGADFGLELLPFLTGLANRLQSRSLMQRLSLDLLSFKLHLDPQAITGLPAPRLLDLRLLALAAHSESPHVVKFGG